MSRNLIYQLNNASINNLPIKLFTGRWLAKASLVTVLLVMVLSVIAGYSAYGDWDSGLKFLMYAIFLTLPGFLHSLPFVGIPLLAIADWRNNIYSWGLDIFNLPASELANVWYWLSMSLWTLGGVIAGLAIVYKIIKTFK